MSLSSRRKTGQRGAALILFVTVLVIGVAWYAVGALGKAPVAKAEREVKTGLALQAAKQALLAHVVQYAARSTTADPGQLPCPESVNLTNVSEASTSCSNVAATVGRLPWKTLGIDHLLDGDGEPLWYVISPGFRNPPINFGTTGQLTYDGVANAAVAVIFAPGRPVNTLSEPGTPPTGCSVVSQQVAARNTAPLNPANFLECGNATGSYANPGTSQWTNDRAVAITAAEWADAIAPAINDRLQREVAPVLGDWHSLELATTGKSWAATHGLPFLPYASTWLTTGNPTTNNYCGNDGVREGLPPTAQGCSANPWTGNASGLLSGLSFQGCTDMGTDLRCRFQRIAGVLLPAQITATAVDVARTYRSTIRQSDIVVTGGGSATLSMALSGGDSNATATIDVSWPVLALGVTVDVRIPHLQEAAALSDPRLMWWRTNNWHRYTYYAIAPGAAAPATSPCVPGTSCLTATGLPASTGAANDKRLVLTLMGRPLATQTQPSGTLSNYLEAGNATTGDDTFVSAVVSGTFNDRIAACPFKHVDQGGANVVVCN